MKPNFAVQVCLLMVGHNGLPRLAQTDHHGPVPPQAPLYLGRGIGSRAAFDGGESFIGVTPIHDVHHVAVGSPAVMLPRTDRPPSCRCARRGRWRWETIGRHTSSHGPAETRVRRSLRHAPPPRVAYPSSARRRPAGCRVNAPCRRGSRAHLQQGLTPDPARTCTKV